MWDLEKDVGTGCPFLNMFDWDTDLGNTAFKGCQGGAAEATVIVCKAQTPNNAVYEI